MEIRIRSINKPEQILDQNLNLEKVLSPYGNKVIGIIRGQDRDTKYYEGTLLIQDTVDENGYRVKDYSVKTDKRLVPLVMGDGLFLKELPTKPYFGSPEMN